MNPTASIHSSRPGARRVEERRTEAFTLIEITISLAIIAFALVAIVGILPLGMSVQRENRELTVINQDATVWINAIRNGERSLDDLTNYVESITNIWTLYRTNSGTVDGPHLVWYSPYGSSSTPELPLTNAFHILGLLSYPKYIPVANGFISNYTIANVRSISGPASEKVPQTNDAVRDLSLSYRMIVDIMPNSDYSTNWYWTEDPAISANPAEIAARSNYWLYVKNVQTNLHDVRLTFRWPLLGERRVAGNSRQVYRTMVGGVLMLTNDFVNIPPHPLYLFEPRNFVKAP